MSKESLAYVLLSCFRYNCNRYNEDDAKAARDAQEVIKIILWFSRISRLTLLSSLEVVSQEQHPIVYMHWFNLYDQIAAGSLVLKTDLSLKMLPEIQIFNYNILISQY